MYVHSTLIFYLDWLFTAAVGTLETLEIQNDAQLFFVTSDSDSEVPPQLEPLTKSPRKMRSPKTQYGSIPFFSPSVKNVLCTCNVRTEYTGVTYELE